MPKYERFIAATDLHGDLADSSSVAAMFDFMGHWKPKHRLFLGDLCDFRWLRSKASDEDKLDDGLQADIDAGVSFLDRYRCTTFLMGNHDHRVIKGMESHDPAKAKLCGMIWGDLQDALRGVKPVMYNKRYGVHQFGDRKLLHGYASGIGAARKHALIFGDCWMGHLHSVECVTTERHDTAECRVIGTLAKLELGYNDTHLGTLRQQAGFLYGCIFPSGKTVAWQAQAVDGVWLFPSEMREVKCA